jgi:hypothetical protein
MARNRASAKQAGTAFETAICNVLVDAGWPHAERRRLSGAYDKGDIAGVPGVVIESKNTPTRMDIAGALDEALSERDNAKAAIGFAWLKRKGRTSPLDGYVVMDGHTVLQLLKEAGY